MSQEEPHLIKDIPLAELSAAQIYGRSCVFCRSTASLAYAGWLRCPLAPGRHVSAPVTACARCRIARTEPVPSEVSP